MRSFPAISMAPGDDFVSTKVRADCRSKKPCENTEKGRSDRKKATISQDAIGFREGYCGNKRLIVR
jgi:hypothetical protein